MSFTQLATPEVLNKTVEGLTKHGYQVSMVASGKEALEKIKTLIPPGASIMNGSSKTLDQIGFKDYLKSGQHPWNNLHEGILAEKDETKQKELRRQAVLSDYYVGSVHALMQNGEFIVASNTASQLPHIVRTSPNLIFVVSTKKIVADLSEAMKRLEEHVIPLENKRMQSLFGVDTVLNKILFFKGESPVNGRTITFILVHEDLGF